MSIVGAIGVHRRQLAFEYLDTATGELKVARWSHLTGSSCRPGQRGQLCKIGFRSIPNPGTGRPGWSKLVTKIGCYVQLNGRGGRI